MLLLHFASIHQKSVIENVLRLFFLFTSILFGLGKNQAMHPLIESDREFPKCSDIIWLSNSNSNLSAQSLVVSTYPYLRAIFLYFGVSFFQEGQNGVDGMHIFPPLVSNYPQKNTKCLSQQYQAIFFHCPIYLLCSQVTFYSSNNKPCLEHRCKFLKTLK